MSKGNLIKETPYSEITATLEALGRFGINRKDLSMLRSDSNLAARVVNFIKRKNISRKPIHSGFPVLVDYEMNIKEAVKIGCLDEVEPIITGENFPTEEVGAASIIVEAVPITRIHLIGDALIELNKKGYRPACLRELISLGNQYSEFIKEKCDYLNLIALGSICYDLPGKSDVYLAPILTKKDSKLNIETISLKDHCLGTELFAAVRK